jgi:hypothetical protein
MQLSMETTLALLLITTLVIGSLLLCVQPTGTMFTTVSEYRW